MKFLYVLAALPILALAAPAPAYPYPSGYYPRPKRDGDAVLAKRQVTVADLKRRADDYDDHDKKKYKPSGYYPRATQVA
ncbi:hypothetical protein JB92DRAFT_3104833 [Gautieria morchelliformis]|nr:hypothetical protein JB92DRAFT_3104833 [Gautieria morchelliformis]